MIIIKDCITNEEIELTETEMILLRDCLFDKAYKLQMLAAKYPHDSIFADLQKDFSNLYHTFEKGLV